MKEIKMLYICKKCWAIMTEDFHYCPNDLCGNSKRRFHEKSMEEIKAGFTDKRELTSQEREKYIKNIKLSHKNT